MDGSLIAAVLGKAFSILSTSIDVEERRNAQSTIDRLVELLGKDEVAKLVLGL